MMTNRSILLLTVILMFCVMLLVDCGEECYFGKHTSVPAQSCQNIIDVQPGCYGENGYYWIRSNSTSDLEYVYCDMDHKGGGWRRVIYYHSDINMTCPFGLFSETFYGGTRTYCTKYTNDTYSVFTWNSNGYVEFSEIRGYATLKVMSSVTNLPDAFDDRTNVNLEDGYLDGFELLTGTYPGGILRLFFAYIIGISNGDRCPVNGGNEYNIGRVGYRSYSYACDEIQYGGTTDSEGFYSQDLFTSNDSCVQCPPGSPWFEKNYARVLTITKIYGRLVNSDSDDEKIYLKDIELYIR